MKLNQVLSKLLINTKKGKQKNALNYPYNHKIDSKVVSSDLSPLYSDKPIIDNSSGSKAKESWLTEIHTVESNAITLSSDTAIDHNDLIIKKYDVMVSRLLQEMAIAAKWNRINSKARIHIKSGEQINGGGWVIYRVHSSGEALLPEDNEPRNYTLFNFWQVSFDCNRKIDGKPDYQTWNMYAMDTLPDFDRLVPDEIEKWLKDQLYRMYKSGCIWVALPNLIETNGKSRKPTIQDALYTYNLISFGRNYDIYQTEIHFYDRPPFNNQFLPGNYKR